MSEQAEVLIEATGTERIMARVAKLLAKAEHIANMPAAERTQDLVNEAEALNVRAAELIAKYGIDRAMLAANDATTDAILDEVIWLERPFAGKMYDLLYACCTSLRAQARGIKQWDITAGPKAKGGIPRGGWKWGVRV